MRVAAALILALLVACADEPAAPSGPPPAPPRPASGDTVDVQGVRAARAQWTGDVKGSVTLRQFEGGVRVMARASGLRPDRRYGLTVLAARSCEGADPAVHLGDGRTRHGPYDAGPRQRHAGDLGNLDADDRGAARYDRIDTVLPLAGYLSAVGRAVVLRERQDDGHTPPDGGAGSVLACGVLEPAR